ncbi:hypothetical protein [Citrobacter arsenatis]|uniref:hypothetical protein n=1 Tax=Citrobacter arsenatis TaxID=2546350 RepID=UPI00300E457C
MDMKDILGLVIAAIAATPAIFGAYKFFKDVSWFLPKATRYSHLMEKYPEFLDPFEVDFLKVEIKRDIKRSVLRISNIKSRNLVLYIRTNAEMTIPSWQWATLAPHIQNKYGKFFIRYKGKYRRYRIYSKLMCIAYIMFGLMYSFAFSLGGTLLTVIGVSILLISLLLAAFCWMLFPSEKKINEYNSQLLKVDSGKYQAI